MSDFLGGLASKRAGAFAVVLWSQMVGLGVAVVSAPLLAGTSHASDLVWGAMAGASGGLGLLALYAGLATGRMAVVAPVSAVCGTALPVGVGLVLGERFDAGVWVGVALAIPAVYLVGAGGRVQGSGLMLGVLAGLGFAGFFVSLAATADEAGLWPLVPARVASMTIVWVVARGRREPLTIPSGRRLVVAAGAGDMSANIAYLLAVQSGPLTSTVVLASLYPAVTVLLARIVLSEQIRRTQWLGIALAVTAVTLIASGT